MNDASSKEPFNPCMKFESIVDRIKKEHKTSYQKIADLNKSIDLSEEEWPIDNVIASFSNTLRSMAEKSRIVNEKINRDIIKIFMFGKVSVGKSKIINSILKEELFVSAASHTTSCFVHIKISPDSSYSIKYRNKEESFNDLEDLVTRLEELGTAHDMNNTEKLDDNESIEFYLNIEDNKILKEGTEIIDCPGAGNRRKITESIKSHSLDADIFIFVMSHALTDQDKEFFKYQTSLSSKPDIFILINGWDNSDNDSDRATVKSKESITKQCTEFLIKNGGITDEEIPNRIFFISAMEMFKIRVLNDNSIINWNEKVRSRSETFENFENKLAEYIDKPLENKKRRYKQEIEQILRDIDEEFNKFKDEILNLRQQSLSQKYKMFVEELNGHYQLIVSKCEEKKEELRMKMTDAIDRLDESKPDVNQLSITGLQTTLENDVEAFFKSLGKEMSQFLKKKEEEMLRNLFKKKKPTLKENLDSTRYLQSTKPNDNEEKLLKYITDMLTIVPLTNLKTCAFFTVVSAGGYFLYEKIASDNMEKMRVENRNKLNELKTELSKAIDKQIDCVNQHFEKNIKKLIELFRKKTTLFDEYWRNIEEILWP